MIALTTLKIYANKFQNEVCLLNLITTFLKGFIADTHFLLGKRQTIVYILAVSQT